MHLYFIRHGESFINLPNWTDFSRDHGLTKKGHAQAEALAKWLPAHLPVPQAIYASTLKRTRETVGYLSETVGIEPTFDDRIREIGNNHHDHQPFATDETYPYADFWASAHPFENVTPEAAKGESMMHFKSRIGIFLESIMQRHLAEQDVVFIVCHGYVIDMVVDIVFNVGTYRRCEVWTSNTGILHLEHVAHPGREVWRLHAQNMLQHLAGLDL